MPRAFANESRGLGRRMEVWIPVEQEIGRASHVHPIHFDLEVGDELASRLPFGADERVEVDARVFCAVQ